MVLVQSSHSESLWPQTVLLIRISMQSMGSTQKKDFTYIYLELLHSIQVKINVLFGKSNISDIVLWQGLVCFSQSSVFQLYPVDFTVGLHIIFSLVFMLSFFVTWRLQYCCHFSQWHSVIFTFKCIYIEHLFHVFFSSNKKTTTTFVIYFRTSCIKVHSSWSRPVSSHKSSWLFKCGIFFCNDCLCICFAQF